MRTRTQEEKIVMGKAKDIFRALKLKEETPGTIPLLDLIAFAGANSEIKFLEIMQILWTENYYVKVEQAKKETPETEALKAVLSYVKENATICIEQILQDLESQFDTDNIMVSRVLNDIRKAGEGTTNAYKLVLYLQEKLENAAYIATWKTRIVQTIETALEASSEMQLQKYGLEKLSLILNENEDIESQLLEELGEKYQDYTHEERVIVFFVKKILKTIDHQQNEMSMEQLSQELLRVVQKRCSNYSEKQRIAFMYKLIDLVKGTR